MEKVCVVLVTYNRKQMLLNLLEALAGSTYPIDSIIIVDNKSTDATSDFLMERGLIFEAKEGEITQREWKNININYYLNTFNAGGSGGFAKAFSLVREMDFDVVWAMDDDVQPEEDCLSEMMKYLDDDCWMAIPNRGDKNFTDYAIQHYNLTNPFFFHVNECKRDMINGETLKVPYVSVEDMAFEGPLMRMELIRKIGIPDKNYFIIFDDTDYAHRALAYTKIRYIRDAHLHKQIVPKPGQKWTWKSFYSIRNSVYFDRKYGENAFVRHLRPFFRIFNLTLRAVVKGNLYRVKWIIRAYFEGKTGCMGKTVDASEIPVR